MPECWLRKCKDGIERVRVRFQTVWDANAGIEVGDCDPPLVQTHRNGFFPSSGSGDQTSVSWLAEKYIFRIKTYNCIHGTAMYRCLFLSWCATEGTEETVVFHFVICSIRSCISTLWFRCNGTEAQGFPLVRSFKSPLYWVWMRKLNLFHRLICCLWTLCR